MEIRVREATVEESDLVAALRIEMIEESEGKALEADLADANRLWMRAMTRRGAMRSWLAECDEGVVGTVTVRIREASPKRGDLAGSEAYVHNLYVRAAYRRGGIGRRLMRALLEWCEANGHTRVALRATEMGRPLYESLGFVADRAMVYRSR